MQPVEPVYTADLFSEINSHLIQLLKSLSAEEWQQPTICDPWTVKDLAAHLLDTNIRRLSFQRDRLSRIPPDRPITSYEELVAFLNRLNQAWVEMAARFSPNVLIDFLDLTGRQLADFFKTLDLQAPASAAVAWAGDEVSPIWFDMAREFTEKWLHQQQIRDALGRPGLNDRRYLYPVLDTFIRGLPHAYRNITAPEGSSVAVTITGEAGGAWTLQREQGGWRLYYGQPPWPAARIELDQDTAWRLFTKGLSPEIARSQVRIEGEATLGAGLLGLVSIMA
jgi:uncharacterized protein (TIGR03083 family)